MKAMKEYSSPELRHNAKVYSTDELSYAHNLGGLLEPTSVRLRETRLKATIIADLREKYAVYDALGLTHICSFPEVVPVNSRVAVHPCQMKSGLCNRSKAEGV